MLLRHSLRLEREAQVVETAVASAIAAGSRTADLCGGSRVYGTTQMGTAIRSHIDDVLAGSDLTRYLATHERY
jgi:3-isopropylmalate dehydrogenase